MSATFWKLGTSNAFSTTLNGTITAGDSEIVLTTTSGLQYPGVIVIDRVDIDGTDTPSRREYISYTGITSNTLTGCSRGLGGSSAQSHDSSAVVEEVWTITHWNDLHDLLSVSLNSAGNIVTSTATITNIITDTLKDANGNEVLKLAGVSSAVNEITTTNATTGNAPSLSATGGDTNIDLELLGKGTGKVKVDSLYGDIESNSDGATITFNCANSNVHTVTLGGNRTLALSNVAVGQRFIINLVQDATGSRTVTWFSTIKWPGGTTPTLTTTANKTDSFGFLCTSSGNYLGFILGQNL